MDDNTQLTAQEISLISRQMSQLNNWTTGQLDNWTIGQLDNWTTGQLDNWTTGQLDNWTTGQLDNWTTGQLDNWTTGQLDIIFTEKAAVVRRRKDGEKVTEIKMDEKGVFYSERIAVTIDTRAGSKTAEKVFYFL